MALQHITGKIAQDLDRLVQGLVNFNFGQIFSRVNRVQVFKGTFSVSQNGGAIGVKPLGILLPSGGYVTKVYARVTDALVKQSGGGNTGISILKLDESGGSIGALANAQTYTNIKPFYIFPLANVLTTDGEYIGQNTEIAVSIETRALTAGAIEFYVEYLKLDGEV